MVALAAAFVLALVVALLQGDKPLYYDAGGYWQLADSFTKGGHFSLLNYDDRIRGYLLPLTNHGLRELTGAGADDSSPARVFNALILALTTTVLAPAFARLTWPAQSWGVGRRLALTVIVLVFWRGYLNYPLSDIPALAAVLLALVAVARADRPGWMLVAGLSAAAAIDMRPSYLLIVPVIGLLLAFGWWRERGAPHASWLRRALGVGLLVAGFALVSLPQSLSAHRHYDTWSFVPGASGNLSALQFTEGLRMQRYDSYVGGDRPPQMIYADPTGSKILAERPDGVVNDAGEYLGVIADHPLAMIGVFGRHLVNGLDARHSTPYIEHPDTRSSRWMRILGFLLVFLALARVAWPTARRALGTTRWRYPAALLLAGSTAVASAVETRFLLPAYLLTYLLVLAPGWPSPLLAPSGSGLRRFRTPAILAVALVLFFAIVLRIVGIATDHLQYGFS